LTFSPSFIIIISSVFKSDILLLVVIPLEKGQKMQNSQIKDSLFVDLFQNDEMAKENFLSLYNAIAGTDLKIENTKIEPRKLERVAYHSLYNDVSMIVNDKLIVLVEHQSTINENMPLRFLLYVARLYETVVPRKDRYRRNVQSIPTPEFYVIYNGIDDYLATKELHLSDAFRDKSKVPMLDLTVTVYNVTKCQNLPIIKNCAVLNDYVRFIELVRKHLLADEDDGYKKAIEEAESIGLLPNYLERKVSEVYNFLLSEYDYDTDIAVQREETYEEGVSYGAHNQAVESAKEMLNMNMPIDQIAKISHLSKEEISLL
jgi:predicted transposase/invertase (TIGR01784 family)